MLKVHLPEYSLACFALGGLTALIALRFLIARTFLGWMPFWLQLARDPNERSIPRTGGLAIVCGVLVVALVGWLRGAHLAAPSATTGLLVGMGGMFLVGLFEDFRPGWGRFRIPAQVIVALGSVASGLHMDHSHLPVVGDLDFSPLVSTVVTVGWLVLCTNVIGLVNGVEGAVGGISLMVFGLNYDVAAGFGDAGVALFVAGMAGGLSALLWYNFPPAKILLGRNGTYLLGMALGGLSIEVSHKGAVQFAFLAPTLAMGLPFLDVAIVIARRLIRGVPLLRADRRHVHHRLEDQGLDPIQTLMVMYAVSVCFLAGGFVVMWTQGQLIPLVLTLVMVLALLFVRQLSRSGSSTTVRSVLSESAIVRREIKNAQALARWLSLQSERVSNFDEFWSRACTVAADLQLLGLELQGDGISRYYSSGLPKNDGLSSRHRIAGPNGISIQLLVRGDSAKTAPHLFYTLSELFTEAFQDGLQRAHHFKLQYD